MNEEFRKEIQQESENSFREYAIEHIGYMNILTTEMGFEHNEAIEFLKLLALREISEAMYLGDNDSVFGQILDALERIDKNIDGCISVSQNGKSRYLCISGDVCTN